MGEVGWMRMRKELDEMVFKENLLEHCG